MPSQPPLNWHAFAPSLVRDAGARTVVEVGVCKGDLSEALLKECPAVEHLWLVDPWRMTAGQRDDGRYVIIGPGETQEECDEAARITAYKMGPYKGRVTILRKPSVGAAQGFEDGSLDAVLIDALHFANFVIEDIQAWWPKLKMGGLMIGDDWGPYFPGVEVGVRQCLGDNFRVWGMAERATWWTTKEARCLGNGSMQS